MRSGNPFVLGQPLQPPMFVGYHATLQSTLARLGSPLRGSTSIVGAHFAGRTSFLRYLVSDLAFQQHSELHSYIPIYVELFEDPGCDPQRFWLDIAEATCAACKDDEQLCSQFDKLIGKWQTRPPSMVELRTLNDVVAKTGRALLLALDNFEVLMANPNFTPPRETQFFERLRNLCQREPHGIAVVMTTPRPLLDLWHHPHGSWFIGLYATYQVGRLTDTERDQLLDRLLSGTGMQFSKDCKAALGRWSGNLPPYIQHFGELLYDAVVDGLGDEAAVEYVEAKLNDRSSVHVQLTRTLLRSLRDDELAALTKRITHPTTVSPIENELLQHLTDLGAIPPLALVRPVAEALAQEVQTGARISIASTGSSAASLNPASTVERKLSGRECELLVTAIKSVASSEDLQEIVRYDCETDLNTIVFSAATGHVVFKLVLWAERNNKLDDLLDGVLRRYPDNTYLKTTIDGLRHT